MHNRYVLYFILGKKFNVSNLGKYIKIDHVDKAMFLRSVDHNQINLELLNYCGLLKVKTYDNNVKLWYNPRYLIKVENTHDRIMTDTNIKLLADVDLNMGNRLFIKTLKKLNT